ncbi:hypothetical protein L3X38_016059 [Prunus dulcis]|uniref:Uncharacterized protein n=1 Tax=Prunus dulcis TaxID=3755 RepID=A0AAD4Z8F7_PRUDU|nr:hypothetical protein L3X38_016059 [Prunus dulcis]
MTSKAQFIKDEDNKTGRELTEGQVILLDEKIAHFLRNSEKDIDGQSNRQFCFQYFSSQSTWSARILNLLVGDLLSCCVVRQGHEHCVSAFICSVHEGTACDVHDGCIKMGKKKNYRKCGWTEDDFLLEFRKNPLFMNFSEMNFSSKIDFLMNEIASRCGWKFRCSVSWFREVDHTKEVF